MVLAKLFFKFQFCVKCFKVKYLFIAVCDMRAVKDHPEIYEQYVEGWGFIPRPCAIGTVFNQTECMCAEYTKVKIPGKGMHTLELLAH